MMEAAALARVGVERLICGDDRRCAGRTQRTSRNDARACMHGIQLMLALALIALLGAPAAAAACTADADCDDGLFCDGAETCQSGACVAATAVDCSTAADQCNDAACSEISRSCVRTPKIDGFVCDDGNACTATDVCQSGVCVGSDGADSDGDGYCDRDEIQAQCNPNDPQEIPPQANVYQGGRVGTRGDVLMTFLTPGDLKVSVATNPSCATAGICNQATHFCTAGAVADP